MEKADIVLIMVWVLVGMTVGMAPGIGVMVHVEGVIMVGGVVGVAVGDVTCRCQWRETPQIWVSSRQPEQGSSSRFYPAAPRTYLSPSQDCYSGSQTSLEGRNLTSSPLRGGEVKHISATDPGVRRKAPQTGSVSLNTFRGGGACQLRRSLEQSCYHLQQRASGHLIQTAPPAGGIPETFN